MLQFHNCGGPGRRSGCEFTLGATACGPAPRIHRAPRAGDQASRAALPKRIIGRGRLHECWGTEMETHGRTSFCLL